MSLYTKYPSGDAFAKNCEQIAENYGLLSTLESRNYKSPDGREDGGTLFPFDMSISGWCGKAAEAGQRQPFIVYDMTDFSEASVKQATLKLTFNEFPFGAQLQVYTCSRFFDEMDITWLNRPAVEDTVSDCSFRGEELDYPAEQVTAECDITNEVKNACGSHICFTMIELDDGGSQQAITFYSKDFDEVVERAGIWEFDPSLGFDGLGHGTVFGEENTWKPHIVLQASRYGRHPDFQGDE